MKIVLRIDKNLAQNASDYFDKSKKAKKKLFGLQKAVLDMEKKIEATREKESFKTQRTELKEKRTKKWFEKFHWFNSSDNFLVISGRDAKSNETLVKKHMEKNDVYFHAEIFGAPHTIIKTNAKKVPQKTIFEAAQFAAIFSRAWKQKLAAVDVYSVKPEQVSKSAPAGESIGTGAFMIYGKREWFRKTPLEFAIGVDANGSVISGPKDPVLKHAKAFVEVMQGEEKSGAIAKKIKKFFEEKTGKKTDIDEIVSMLPAGGISLTEK